MDGEAEKQTQSSDIRLEQVENAVNFLSHPKVRDSSESSKRSFLVGKGLTDAEISEAFRRVPGTSIQNTATDRHVEPATALQPRQHPEGYSWTSVALGLGFTAAAVYSIKSLFGPTISNAIQSWRSSGTDPVPVEEDGRNDELAKAVREQTEQMRQSLESLENFIRSQSEFDSQKEDSISQLRDEVRHLTEKLGNQNPGEEIESGRSPMSYMEVLEMLEKGETPPGIRDDINDKPPDPTMSPPISKLKPVPKPWHNEMNESSSFIIDEIDVSPSDAKATTPSRRDLSGQRAASIYQSIESTPEKNPSVLVEQAYSTTEEQAGSMSGSIKVDGSLGRKMMKNWRPPPLPTPSLSSPDASSTT